ncbi:MAG: hypothetical protein WBQ61_14685 [Candidatus Acidiferrum sp.]
MKNKKKGSPHKRPKSAPRHTLDPATARALLDALSGDTTNEDTEREKLNWMQMQWPCFLMGNGPNLFGEEENQRITTRHAELYAAEVSGTASDAQLSELRQLQRKIGTALEQAAHQRQCAIAEGQIKNWWID